MSTQTQIVRVAMHAHSEWSYDADWPLSRIAKVMPHLGASVVMMSEHDTGFPAERFEQYRAECAAASTKQCLIIPGIEYSDETNSVHLPTWGLTRFLGEARSTVATLNDVAADRGASIFAHPARRDVWSVYQDSWTALLSGLEIWNRKSDGLAPGQQALTLLQQTGLPPTIGMDFHRVNHLWPLINHVEIESPVSEAKLVQALRAGRMTPYAFGAPLMNEAGTVRHSRHKKVENARKWIKTHILRRKR
ncbi:MAG: PHP domain-containing protein [Sedimentitalea sp.]